MRRTFRMQGLFAVMLAIMAGLVNAGSVVEGASSQGDTAALTIHFRLCDEKLPDEQYYAACHESGFASQYVAAWSDEGDSFDGTTDSDGNITLDVSPGIYHLTAGVLTDASVDEYVFCSPTDDPSAGIDYPATIGAGDSFVCDYYLVRGSLAVPTDEPAPDSTATPPASASGENVLFKRPAGIFEGTCSEVGAPISELEPLISLAVDPVGAAQAVPVGSSYSEIDQSLDELLAEPKTIVLFDPESEGKIVACGAIGGVVLDDGSMAMGITSEDGSYSGVAYFTPNDDDSTGVTVFLIAN